MAARRPRSAALWERYMRLAGMPVDHDLGGYQNQLDRIDAVGAPALTDTRLKSRFEAPRREAACGRPADALLPEVYALRRARHAPGLWA